MTTHIHLSLVELGGEPPTEFQLFPAGKFKTKKGEFLFDEVAQASVLKAAAEHGADFSIDFNHASLNPNHPNPSEALKAAGFFRVEVREAALWAVNVRWTEAAAESIRKREIGFISPAARIDPETGRVLSIINIAVTNTPAMNSLQPLLAASITGPAPEKEEKPMKTILAALSLSDSATEAEALAKVAKVVDFQKSIVSMTGATDGTDAIVKVKGLSLKAEEHAKVTEELSALKTKQDSERQTAEIDKAISEFRLKRAKREEMVAFGQKHGTDVLIAVLSQLPKQLDTEDDLPKPGNGGSGGTGASDAPIKLTAEGKKNLAKFGVTPEEYAKLAPQMQADGMLEVTK